jgi:predicted AAA+ superfamily ATPase
MLERLNRLIEDVRSLNSKLILLIGPPRCGKTRLLDGLAKHRNTTVLNVGGSLGRQMLEITGTQRHLQAAALMSALAADHSKGGLVLFDNIELLFDQSLRLDTLDLLKRNGRTRCVVAAWPGEFNNSRITYATLGHPERRDHAIDGFVPFEIK